MATKVFHKDHNACAKACACAIAYACAEACACAIASAQALSVGAQHRRSASAQSAEK